jgi:glycosyltransferase involved in cell wall biosynthesis
LSASFPGRRSTAGPKILFVCPSLDVGGAERQLSLLVPALAVRGMEPAVVTIRGRGRFFDQLTAEGVAPRFLEVRSRFDLAGVRRAVREVGTWPDIVVSQSLDAQLVGHAVARHARVPHLTIHHKQPEIVPSLHRRLLTRLVARRIDCVVAVTEAQIPDLVSSGFLRERIRVIENGVPEPAVTRSEKLVRRELGLESGVFVALLAATLRPEKRPGVFVDAVLSAHARDRTIRGVVAGNGPELEAVTARAGSGSVVTVVGERADVGDLIAASNVVCLTSSAEALPMLILEAMALGKPVVSTDVGGIHAAVIHGETGLLTPVDQGEALESALVGLAQDRPAVAAMGHAARRRYEERYSAELMSDRYATLLGELLPTRGG